MVFAQQSIGKRRVSLSLDASGSESCHHALVSP
jgi:hypothetical protein